MLRGLIRGGLAAGAGAMAGARQAREAQDERERQQAMMEMQRTQMEELRVERERQAARQAQQDALQQYEGGYRPVEQVNERGRGLMGAESTGNPMMDMGVQFAGAAQAGARGIGDTGLVKGDYSVAEQRDRTQAQMVADRDARAAAARAAERGEDREFTRERDEAARAQATRLAEQSAALQRSIAGMRYSDVGQPPQLKPAPMAVVSDIQGNVRQLKTIDEALTQLDANPAAVGMKSRLTPDYLLDRLPMKGFRDGAHARAGIADIGSLEIRDRSGAAVTASEFPRLRPFIPSADDPEDVVRMKLRRMRDIIAEETEARNSYFGPDNGFAPIVDPSQLRGRPVDAPASQGMGGGRPPLDSFVRP